MNLQRILVPTLLASLAACGGSSAEPAEPTAAAEPALAEPALAEEPVLAEPAAPAEPPAPVLTPVSLVLGQATVYGKEGKNKEVPVLRLAADGAVEWNKAADPTARKQPKAEWVRIGAVTADGTVSTPEGTPAVRMHAEGVTDLARNDTLPMSLGDDLITVDMDGTEIRLERTDATVKVTGAPTLESVSFRIDAKDPAARRTAFLTLGTVYLLMVSAQPMAEPAASGAAN
jgi:hypothetical protein